MDTKIDKNDWAQTVKPGQQKADEIHNCWFLFMDYVHNRHHFYA